jgi:superoxide dismutase, Fe-Mn family
MQYKLPDLPYSYDALEPHIDAKTMQVHHDGHHRTYVEHLNMALADYPELQKKSLEDLLTNLQEMPRKIREKIRENGGGHFNHSLLWTLLTPTSDANVPWQLENAFEDAFGSRSLFQEKFSKAATKLFGSGYIWLCLNGKDKLEIVELPNQDCPLSYELKPIFLMDLWEHAYYLKNQNRRDEYIESFWKVVNWQQLGHYFLQVQKNKHLKVAA